MYLKAYIGILGTPGPDYIIMDRDAYTYSTYIHRVLYDVDQYDNHY